MRNKLMPPVLAGCRGVRGGSQTALCMNQGLFKGVKILKRKIQLLRQFSAFLCG